MHCLSAALNRQPPCRTNATFHSLVEQDQVGCNNSLPVQCWCVEAVASLYYHRAIHANVVALCLLTRCVNLPETWHSSQMRPSPFPAYLFATNRQGKLRRVFARVELRRTEFSTILVAPKLCDRSHEGYGIGVSTVRTVMSGLYCWNC